ncbi:MAG: NAD(P)/FAD-dependent oxidoreductase [Egibacteraceae bacterium]
MESDRNGMGRHGGRAVVIGGSLAGLAAAGALGKHFDHVTIVERDRFPDEPAFRAGVPQGRHAHILLTAGQEALERLFPGFRDDLVIAGAIPVGVPEDVLWHTAAGWSHRFPATRRLLSCSRHLIDWTVRRRLKAMGNVDVLDGCIVAGLSSTHDRREVTGVRLRDGGTRELRADLVVDASGRSSRMPDWLEPLGYGRPAETRIDAQLGYASRVYAIPQGFTGDWKALFLLSQPPTHGRMGLLAPIEGDRWIASVMGTGGDYPPTDEAGLLEWIHGMRTPVLYEAITEAEPLSPIYGHRGTDNRRRHYEAMSRWPERLVVVGDAACAFNPVYGQGMSVGALTAVALDDCLRPLAGDLSGFARRFQQVVASCNADAWLAASGEDLRYPTTIGARPNGTTQFMHRYMEHVLAVALVDNEANRVFVDVLNMMAPARSLLTYQMAVRVAHGPQTQPPSGPPTLTEPAAAVA